MDGMHHSKQMIWDISSILKVNCHVSECLEFHSVSLRLRSAEVPCQLACGGVKASMDAARVLSVPMGGY